MVSKNLKIFFLPIFFTTRFFLKKSRFYDRNRAFTTCFSPSGSDRSRRLRWRVSTREKSVLTTKEVVRLSPNILSRVPVSNYTTTISIKCFVILQVPYFLQKVGEITHLSGEHFGRALYKHSILKMIFQKI